MFAKAAQKTSERPHLTVPQIRQILLNAENPSVLIVAHRAYHRYVPENSIAAINAAAEAGIPMVEIDVRTTADSRFVLMHDATVQRTTNGTGKVAVLTLNELKKLQLRHEITPTAERIPTLEEALLAAKDKVMVNLDLKAIKLVQAVITARELDLIDHVLFKAAWYELSEKDIQWIRDQKDVMFMPVVSSVEQLQSALKDTRWPAIEVVMDDASNPLFNAEVLQQVRRGGTRVFVNTLKNGSFFGGISDEQAVFTPRETFCKAIEKGAGMIQTDLPDLALQALSSTPCALKPSR